MDDLNEKVLDIAQRQRRAQIMRRNKAKIERAREIAQKRRAPESNIRKRAFVQARQIIRRKVAGARGAEYEKLGPSEKMAIDRAVEGKQKLIKKLALRLIPRVKQAESKRLATFMKGQSLENQGRPEGKSKESSGSSSVNESLNDLFTEAFPPTDVSNALGQKVDAPVVSSDKKMPPKGKSKNTEIIQYNKFQEEVEYDTPAFASLFKKSEKSGIDLETLGEVYNRGWNAWPEDCKVTQEQFAFARVNSYINQGKTYFNEDADLHEMGGDQHYSDTKGAFSKGAKGTPITSDKMKKDTSKTLNKMFQKAMKKEEVEIEEGRAPGTPSIKRYTRNDGTTALKSLNKWGKRKDWRDTEGGLAKAKEHAGVDKITESMGNIYIKKSEASHQTDTTIWPDSDRPQKLQTLYHRTEGEVKNHIKSLKKKYGASNVDIKVTKLKEEVQQTNENFMDGKGPGKPGESILPQTTSKGSKIRKKIEVVDRKPPHTEYTRQAEIKNKIIDEQGNCENDPKKRLMGTDSLVKAYKKDTPGQSKDINEAFNIAYAAGIGQTYTAEDLGMKIQGAFAYHPSVLQQIEDQEEVEEEVKAADKAPVVVPSHKDAYGNVIPAKTVLRKKGKVIVNKGDNPADGQ